MLKNIRVSSVTIKRLSLFVIILSFIFASALVWAIQDKYRFYKDLLKDSENVVMIAERLPIVKVKKSQFEIEFNKIVQDRPIKIIILSDYLYPTEVKYYNVKKLFIIDKLDESEKIVRKDLLDKEGNIRIQIFYGDNGKKIKMDYLTTKGEKINSEYFGFPYIGPWRYY